MNLYVYVMIYDILLCIYYKIFTVNGNLFNVYFKKLMVPNI